MPQIRVKSGPGKGKIIQITTDSVKIGREAECQVQLLESGVSREHAEIYRVGEMFFIRDLGSRNGTSVNELTIEDELLRDGDVVQISNCALIFEGTHEAEMSTASEEDSFFQEEQDPGATLTMKVSPSRGMTNSTSEKFHQALDHFRKLAFETKDPKHIFDECLDLLFKSLEIHEAWVFVLDSSNKLHQKAYKAADGVKRTKASRTVVQRALKEKRTITTANAQEDFRFKSESSIMNRDIHSVLCAPLIALNKEYGVIYLCNGVGKKPFTGENADYVDLISQQVALHYAANEATVRAREIHHSSLLLLEHTVETLVPELSGKAQRVAQMVKVLASELGIKGKRLQALIMAAHLHHLGYLSHLKDKSFTKDFFESDFSYVDKTVDLLSGTRSNPEVIEILKTQRYRLDGKGHPEKLKEGQSWTEEAQILALVIEVDLRVHLPMVFDIANQPLGSLVNLILEEGKHFVSSNVLKAFSEAYRNGLLLDEEV